MALPKSYLTSVKNLGAILAAIQQAKAPERFTVRFLESLDFKGIPHQDARDPFREFPTRSNAVGNPAAERPQLVLKRTQVA